VQPLPLWLARCDPSRKRRAKFTALGTLTLVRVRWRSTQLSSKGCANNQMDLLQLLADELRLVLLASVELFPLPDVDTPRIERKFAPRNAAGAT
jgi:hypothetical protein